VKKRYKNNQPKFINPYKLESELCDVLIEYARKNGWKVYCETSGYDLLLVRDIQIGVQAKLKANIDVLAQVIDGIQSYNTHHKNINPSPHLRAVLVPHASIEFYKVASALGIFVIEGATLEWNYKTIENYWNKKIDTDLDGYNKNYLIMPKYNCWIPEVEINIPAGVKSPKIITEWKVKAVKLCILLEERGYLTSQDFKDMKVSMGLWVKKWLLNTKEKNGKLFKYVRNARATLPDQLYPEIVEAIKNSK
jgi:hypothetical protein